MSSRGEPGEPIPVVKNVLFNTLFWVEFAPTTDTFEQQTFKHFVINISISAPRSH
jgi:hypothetical protein